MADGEVFLEAGVLAGELAFNRNRLHPVDDVLQLQVRADGLRDVHRRPRVAGLGADIQEHRAVRTEDARRRGDPGGSPLQVVGLRQGVFVAVVLNPQVVRRGGNNYIDALGLEVPEDVNAV